MTKNHNRNDNNCNEMYTAFMNLNLEKKLGKQGYQIIIGVDEAGRGPLAGPVIAAAVLLRNFEFRISNFESNPNKKISNDKNWDLIKDSKKLSAKQRESAVDLIQKNFYVGVGSCDHKTIDRINILQATFWAMRKAIASLMRGISKSQPCLPAGRFPISNKIPNFNNKKNTKYQIPNTKYIALVDGNKTIPNLKIKQQAIVKGDDKIFSIAAASIIAKVTRDRWMLKMHRKYPCYGFDKHKGYGTKNHLQNLEKYGPSAIHRLSFRPIKKIE